MAPKAKVEKGVVKAEQKKKEKLAEDKTFGLKNKNKSKTVQKFIKGVQAQAKPTQKSETAQLEAAQKQREDKKKAAQQDALLASLFKGAANATTMAAPTSTPTTIKEEQKIDLYTDQRDGKRGMEGWDQAKLEEVITSKHGNQNDTATDIICKYFVDAVEKRSYGWFWTCPNGGPACKYRHCLPPGYVLKSAVSKEDEEEEEEEPLEEVIERERAQLPAGGTPVTLESLKAWKARKEQQRLDDVEAKRQAEARKTGGRGLAALTGKDLFSFDPSLFVDDDGAADEDDYEDDGDGSSDEDNDSGDNDDNDDAGDANGDNGDASGDESGDENGDANGDDGEKEQAESDAGSSEEASADGGAASSAGRGEAAASSSAAAAAVDGVQRKDLFLQGDVPDDLDELDD